MLKFRNFIKKDNGISMVMLIIIIIVLILIFSVAFSASRSLLDTTKVKKYATVMTLLKGEIENLEEEYEFSGERVFVGTQIDPTKDLFENKIKEILEAEVQVNDYDRYYSKAFYLEYKSAIESGRSTTFKSEYENTYDKWYVITKSDLEKMGIDTDMVDNDENVFIVNYYTADIIYTPGFVVTVVGENNKESQKLLYTLRAYESL